MCPTGKYSMSAIVIFTHNIKQKLAKCANIILTYISFREYITIRLNTDFTRDALAVETKLDYNENWLTHEQAP